MAKGRRQPKVTCRLVPRPDRCGGQKLAQIYRTLVPEPEPERVLAAPNKGS